MGAKGSSFPALPTCLMGEGLLVSGGLCGEGPAPPLRRLLWSGARAAAPAQDGKEAAAVLAEGSEESRRAGQQRELLEHGCASAAGPRERTQTRAAAAAAVFCSLCYFETFCHISPLPVSFRVHTKVSGEGAGELSEKATCGSNQKHRAKISAFRK